MRTKSPPKHTQLEGFGKGTVQNDAHSSHSKIKHSERPIRSKTRSHTTDIPFQTIAKWEAFKKILRNRYASFYVERTFESTKNTIKTTSEKFQISAEREFVSCRLL